MKYPVINIKLDNGFSLYIPDPEKVKSTYEQLSAKDALTPFPFWAKIWASSKALTQFLIEQPIWIQNKKVLEIGAGIGQPSFSVANHAKEIIITDHNVDAMELIQYNIKYNSFEHIKACCLDWNHFDQSLQADTILLSDINYDPTAFKALSLLIESYLEKGTQIIIATPQRIMGTSFIESLSTYIKHSFTKRVEEPKDLIDISIYILYK